MAISSKFIKTNTGEYIAADRITRVAWGGKNGRQVFSVDGLSHFVSSAELYRLTGRPEFSGDEYE
ncbi:MAG TPA: hypothetical protein VFC18_21685 [Burkholderiales bacterium]|nr:hypothetical protein [Burkholderiales bacterium]